ncbi:MAG: acetyltransferase [Leptonema illini]|uniref:Acetyltransferase n=1 Tax=Leptonema illini TaxID=183 RepID=A0A833LZH1_9LEPT|nr:MAG: acetyltransferase [Leptonema illini]
MEQILLIGGGGHCKSCIDVIETQGVYQIAGIIDRKHLVGKTVLGYRIIDTDDNLHNYVGIKNALISVGQLKNALLRRDLYHMCEAAGFSMPPIISPFAYVSKHAAVGFGTIVMHHAFINAEAKVGNNCIINTKAIIEHDAIVGDNCHISTAAVINGGTVVSEGTFFGSNATSKEQIEIGGFVKAGSLAK